MITKNISNMYCIVKILEKWSFYKKICINAPNSAKPTENPSISTSIPISAFVHFSLLFTIILLSKWKQMRGGKKTLNIYINQFWHTKCVQVFVLFGSFFSFANYLKETERECNVIHWQLVVWVSFSTSLIMLFRFNEAVQNI